MDTIINSLIIVGCAMAFNAGIDTKIGRAIQILFRLPKPIGCDKCLSFWAGVGVFIFTGEVAYLGLPYLFAKITEKYLWF